MGKWAERAQQIAAGDGRANSANSAESPPNGTSGTNGTGSMPLNPPFALQDWHKRLSAIDQFTTPPGWAMHDWLKLTDDAAWLYENHASYAVRNGWSALDLFGVRAGMPKRGGLADLIDGARNLKLSGGKAYWSHFGVPFSINIGCGQGCVLLWELER